MSPGSDPHADMDYQLRQRLRAVEEQLWSMEGSAHADDAWYCDDILRHYRGPLSEKQRLRVLRILDKYERQQ